MMAICLEQHNLTLKEVVNPEKSMLFHKVRWPFKTTDAGQQEELKH